MPDTVGALDVPTRPDWISGAGLKISHTHTGAVTLIQRFGSALNLNLHFKALFNNGVFSPKSNGDLSVQGRRRVSDHCRKSDRSIENPIVIDKYSQSGIEINWA